MEDVLLALGIFVAIIAILIGLRAKVGDKFEIKNSDILMALIPIAFWLVLTGKIKIVEFGGFKVEAAFREASQASVSPQITPMKLPVEPLTMDPKTGVDQIPKLLQNQTKALVFQLGYGGYYGPAIEEYVLRLTEFPYLRYIIIQHRDGTFAGIADAEALAAKFKTQPGQSARQLERGLVESNLAVLAELPGFLPAEHAIQENIEIQHALEKLEDLKRETLPVVDSNGRFIGIAERTQLVSSMILDVARRVK